MSQYLLTAELVWDIKADVKFLDIENLIRSKPFSITFESENDDTARETAKRELRAFKRNLRSQMPAEWICLLSANKVTLSEVIDFDAEEALSEPVPT